MEAADVSVPALPSLRQTTTKLPLASLATEVWPWYPVVYVLTWNSPPFGVAAKAARGPPSAPNTSARAMRAARIAGVRFGARMSLLDECAHHNTGVSRSGETFDDRRTSGSLGDGGSAPAEILREVLELRQTVLHRH